MLPTLCHLEYFPVTAVDQIHITGHSLLDIFARTTVLHGAFEGGDVFHIHFDDDGPKTGHLIDQNAVLQRHVLFHQLMRGFEFLDQSLRFSRFALKDVAYNVHGIASGVFFRDCNIRLPSAIDANCAKIAPYMKWFHLIFGVALFFAFTVTGSYMRTDFPDKDAIPQELRLLMRSRHIYILFSALLNVLLGVYLELRPQIVLKVFQILGSTLITLGSMLLVYAWYVETYGIQHFSDLSRYGIYFNAYGVGLHLFGVVSPVRRI